jgi:hypothetical protein
MALEIDNSIKFVGVVNNDGKLIVGANEQQIAMENRVLDKNFFKNILCPSSCNILIATDTYDRNLSINNNNAVFHSKISDLSDFQFICVGKNTFIAFAPLTEEHDKFLCIYFRAYGPIKDIILKLDTIFEDSK